MPDTDVGGNTVEVGNYKRKEDGYILGVTIGCRGIPFPAVVDPKTALDVADEIIRVATIILNQSSAACGCDAKAGWTCLRHEEEEDDYDFGAAKTIES